MEFIKRLKQLLPVTNRSFQERMRQLEQDARTGMDLASQQRAAAADMHWAVNETKAQSDFEKHAARYVNPEITAMQAFPAGAGRILVAGWYGAENLGDELMMRTVVEHIPPHRLADTWVLLWDNFEYPRMALDPRIHVIHYPRSLWELQWYADAFDVLVWGGGAIIDDEQFSNDPLNINTGNLFIHLSSLMLARKKRVLCLGLSTSEDLGDAEFARRLDAVIKGCDAFSLRDPLSIETLERCGIGVDKVEPCHDLVYANRELRQLRSARMLKGSRDEGDARASGRRVVIAFVALCIESMREHYLAVLADLCRADADYLIQLVPFGNLCREDHRYYRSLVEQLAASGTPTDRIEIMDYEADLSKLALTSCDFYISYKYHSALIANVLGIPGLSVCATSHAHYPNKMRYLAETCRCIDSLVEDTSFEPDAAAIVAAGIEERRQPVVPEALLEQTDAWLATVLERGC